MSVSRPAEALALAEELLGDIELSRLAPMDVARKTSRLARLLDDEEAMEWLAYEINGYALNESGLLDAQPWAAAMRSNRVGLFQGNPWAYTAPLGQLEARIQAGLAQIEAASDPDISLSSSNPNQFLAPAVGNANERGSMRNFIGDQRALLDKVIGALHTYVAARYQELRFGTAVETAFEVVRREVDERIGSLIPDALPKVSAAFENAASNNPEQWANAAAGCRRLLMAAADALRPPGGGVNGKAMGPDNYVNRLVDWIVHTVESETAALSRISNTLDVVSMPS
jgi:hypothetical protein